MFSGIVEEVGRIHRLERRGSAATLEVTARRVLEETQVGDSIAVNGACLTVTGIAAGFFAADLAPETLQRTTLGELRPGSPANLERGLSVGARIGGHFVQGHVDAVGAVRARKPEGAAAIITFAAPPAVMRHVVPKGFIAVDGMSLTVVDRLADGFTVSFIPHTLGHTVAGDYQVGTRVNLEADILGKYVERFLSARETETALSREFLARHRFTE